jgi:hypothetical protein
MTSYPNNIDWHTSTLPGSLRGVAFQEAKAL